jgi:hypothetical protein
MMVLGSFASPMRLAWSFPALFTLLIAAVLQPALAGAAPHKEPIVIIFDAPGAVDTSPTGISDGGVMVGNALVEGHQWRAFVRRPDGSFHFLDDLDGLGAEETPGGSSLTMLVSGINNRNDIVGQYFGDDGRFHGFLRERNGALTIIDYPGVPHTVSKAINDKGEIVGNYLTELESPARDNRGFFRDRDGTFIEIDYPGARWTVPEGINNAGTIVGWYRIFDEDDNFVSQGGFVRDRNGQFVSVEPSLYDINDRGDIVGIDEDQGEEFFWPAHHSPRALNVPGCSSPACVAPYFGNGVNNRDEVVGKVRDDAGVHGFLVRFP